jgi:anti-sigma-K factor RskA
MTSSTPPFNPPIHPLTSRTVSPWWRAGAFFLAILLAVAITAGFSMFEVFKAQIENLQTKLQTLPQTRYIAVLTDDQQLPAMLVTFDPHDGALQLQRLNAVSEGREDSMQLWALPAHNGKPRSLGVLESKGRTLRLPASEKSLPGMTQLAISVEDKGGVAEIKGPRLPYLFKGHLVQKAL